MNPGVDARERALAWVEGVYLGGCLRAGQGADGSAVRDSVSIAIDVNDVSFS